jgi:murein DD-endopeptidase MepM/ murein hydrolase activator NlpD
VEKKFKFSDNPTVTKAIYGAVIALLCITAIVVGIIAANNRKKPVTDEPTPPITDGTGDEGNNQNPGEENQGGNENENQGGAGDAVTFIAPVAGRVLKSHSTSIPVFSETLEAWRIHTGIDISTAEGADVFAVAAGEVTKVYADPMLGNTVEITHANGAKTRYSNLSANNLPSVGTQVNGGAKIGNVGDSAISEIADETHLHFEMFVNDTSVNPLDYISEDAKKTSLGITADEAA